MISKKADFAKSLGEYLTYPLLFRKKFAYWQRDVRSANIAFLILQDIFQSHPFLVSQKFETQRSKFLAGQETKVRNSELPIVRSQTD